MFSNSCSYVGSRYIYTLCFAFYKVSDLIVFKMPSKEGKPGSRAHSDHFMVGQEQSDLGVDSKNGKLPLTKDVLRYFFYRKNLPENKFKPVGQSICCPLLTGSRAASCETDCQCVVWKVKTAGNWIASGIPIISDHAIINKIKSLNNEFFVLNKNKKKLKVT